MPAPSEGLEPIRRPRAAATALALALLSACTPLAGRVRPAPAPPPPANPGIGLVRWAGPADALGTDPFPHTLEYASLGLDSFFSADGTPRWDEFETLLDDVAARGNQLIFRVVIDTPGRPTALPQHLLAAGVTTTSYETGGVSAVSPDYEHPAVRNALVEFVTTMGARYDGDPRIAGITAGLLGAWGEWHTWPEPRLFASPAVQAEVLDAYAQAFERTPILLRRPVGPDDPAYTPTTGRGFGYHDDSFAFHTLPTGRPEDAWRFVPMLELAGESDAWRRAPIGGEIRPEIQGEVFDTGPTDGRVESFAKCVAATHASWLLDAAMFRPGVPEERRARAIDAVRLLGYALRVDEIGWRIAGDALHLDATVTNRGIAPCFVDGPFEFGLLGSDGSLQTIPTTTTPYRLQPDDPPRPLTASVPLERLPSGTATLLLRVRTPLASGHPLRFANADQDAALPGWLTGPKLRLPAR